MPKRTPKLTSVRAQRKKSRRLTLLGMILGVAAMTSTGCGLLDRACKPGPHDTTTSYHDNVGLSIEYPQVHECATPVSNAALAASQPMALQDPASLPTLEMTLPDAIAMAMRQSPIIRSLGGSVVSAPQVVESTYGPALTSSSAVGTEAALSAFDAQYAQSLTFGTVDQPSNIQTGGLGAQFTPAVSIANTAQFSGEISKRTATGAQFALRHIVNYSNNNRPFRQFSSDFVGWIEAEWRQPLMKGSGTQYNRIAGTSGQAFQYNGVLIARINEDVALADFENAIVGLAADVEQAYWNLATAYRLLEASVKARESALRTFQYQQVRLEVGAGRQDEEAQAQSQFYQFQAQVENQLGGEQGLYALEQNLRYLLGMPATDGQLIRPITPLNDAKVLFDWDSSLGQALDRRVELRRQRYNLKRRELELYAARLNRRPQVDFVGQYRWRGLGDNLIGDTDAGPLNGLYSSITDGDFQEWNAGVEMLFPIGLRQASAAVANAKLNLQRERALLSETELRISHDLSQAARSIELMYRLLETNFNRFQSDLRQVEVLERRYVDGIDNINFLLQAQNRLNTSESDFYLSLANYNLAIRDFHRQKGSLLAYNQIQLAEDSWEGDAYQDAYRTGRFLTPRSRGDKVSVPAPVSRGSFNPSAVQAQQNVPMSFGAMLESAAPEGEVVDSPQPEVEPTLSDLIDSESE
ncbi:TolC family protein [Stieleria varia]|uniref:Outer membrane efflux protein n=1 Tax=Stieleria varia TaxID=2528005 RepID=A0A5C6B8S4_9BACT|nr:TolC family protein [Stieleria varia]TWU07699.1 Outer membrane efflux protein [Stieleria varia]